MPLYPDREAFYLRPVPAERPVFQGDVFRAVPSVRAAHPTVLEAEYAAVGAPDPRALPAPTYSEARGCLRLEGGYSILLPNPCEFSEVEKGLNHRERILAQVRPIGEVENQKVVRTGRGALYTFWMPHWDHPERPDLDEYASFRRVSTVDAAYLNPKNRVAVLSGSAWAVLIQRLCAFFGGVSLSLEQIDDEVAHLYP